ncbi:IgGFc-binding protein-like [Branchiostoma floridae]|uniref:IgGFc-binding protein-like n=1 Tax=Branchiostoma floridae TaxID=7739 RepID=A0A9J7LBN4_BRAFL|nr:IgGFc-binding protein-like [Branchiostoma floridae]
MGPSAVCISWGDPHYITFDGTKVNFQGACTYNLVQAQERDSARPAFRILATNERRGSDRVSYTAGARIEIYQHVITLGQGRVVMLDGVQVTLPLQLAEGVSVRLGGRNVILRTTFGLRVAYNGNHRLEVSVPPAYTNNIRGLCGNFNNDPQDDLEKPDGTTASSHTEFGNSWEVDVDNSCPGAVEPVNPGPNCEPGLQAVVESENWCGEIRETFQSCNDVVDPTPYFDACVYDVCEYQGSLEVLCQSLEAYAAACLANGVELDDWRTLTLCPTSCPVHQHYTACGSSCPAVCTDLTAADSCNEPCVEGCQCNQGFVLSGQDCIPEDQCGCLSDGIYHALNEEWGLDNGQQCTCHNQNNITCRQVECNDGFAWGLEDGKWDCHCQLDNNCEGTRPEAEGICVSWGDPHYLTFDGRNLNYQGACTYILAKAEQQTDALPAFEIQATNDRRGSNRVSYTDSARIDINGHTVILGQGRIVTLNGLQVTPPVNLAQGINIQFSGPNVVLSTTFGLRVSFDGNHRLEVVVPPAYFNTTQGICGNFNDDSTDDLMMPDGNMAADAVQLGNSWKTNTSCPDQVGPVSPNCDPGLQAIIQNDERCGKIMEDFQACHSVVNPLAYYEACVFDVCEYQGSLEMLCQNLEAYVQACATQGIDLGDWRTPTVCPLTCPVNSHYTTCASACPATCTDVAAPNQCNHPCKEACECDHGFVLSGEVCVPQEQCGCLIDGIYYALNEEWGLENGQRCTCRGENNSTCRDVECNSGFTWSLVDGQWGCHCQQDNVCGGTNPELEGVCVSWGDPHYITFDGRNLNYQGACTYILSKADQQNDQLPAFEIQGTNDRKGSNRVSCTDSASITVYQHTVTIGQGRVVTLNGQQVTTPINLAEGINVRLSGPNVVLSTTFGLRVSFDGNTRLEIVVPQGYSNITQGICGNFNGDDSDDMIMSNGSMASNAIDWGNSWKTNTSCPDEIGTVDPVASCTEGLKTIIESDERCGKIMEDFQACHDAVAPEPYFIACVYDVCEYQGSLEFLCQNLEAYVQACSDNGIDLGEWRTPTICPLTCPINSHYTTCASACPATCTDVAAPNQCNHPCKEACECDLGFVLSGEVCVPQEQCGCLKDGIYYPLGAEWSEANGQTCSCRGQNDISCQQVVCEDGFFWNLEDGTWDCRCLPDRDCDGERGPVEAICVSWGDPHYITFDGKNMNFMGACTYILSKASRQNDQLPAFEIQATNDRRGSDRVSYTDSALINIYQHTVILGQGRIVTLNGLQVTPPVNLAQGINIQMSGPNVVLSTTFGLRVSFDGNHRLEVVVPPTYFNTTQGICGNFNGDQSDDTLKSDGSVAIDANDWGNSWKTNTSCPDEDQIVTPDCEPGLQTIIESNERCGKIMEDFQACHSWVDPQAYYEACVFDVCEYQGSLEMLCQTLEAYVQACAEQGLDLGDWRTPTICPLTCPVNSHYTTCASACPATCTDVAAPNQCNHPCKEACECDLGFVLSGEVCVPQEQCGCLKDGIYYPLGAEWSEANGQTCSCRGQNDISCQQVVCEDGFFWNLEDGTWDCRCLPDRDCDGERGPVEAICVSWGDPHYITFDGMNMNFMGACTYILSKASRQNDQLPAFEIQATNDRRGSDRVSYTDSALINIYQHTVILGQGRIVTLNGLQVTPPVNLAQGINIQMSGPNVVLSTTFGLRVSFDGNHRLEVVVPPTYFNTTQGICGNFNGDKADDMLKSDGIMAIDANEWGNSWKTNTSCPDEVQIVTPDCEPGLQTIIESNERCGKIMEDFQACHSWVDPQAYYEACVFDVCEYQGSLEMLCQTLEAYVQACAEQGLDLGDWRTPTICPLTCPVNSHYTTCASACPATCTDVAAPNQCNHPCKEACECDLGFVLSGEVCVPQEQCGCLKDGIYYPLGAEWSEANGQTCSCRGQNDISCQQVVCEDGFFWNLEDGTWDCRCLPDRDCDGERGPVEAICVSWGDPHYITFDGKNMNFMGACTYILSKASRQNDQLPAFEIQATNDRRGSDRVSYTDSALINIYQHTVILGQGRIVTLNGLQVTPPVNLAQGINIQLSGPNVVLSTTFGLRVSFDGNHRLEVVVPPTYFNTTQGICGNFNGDKADDMLKSDGIMAIDANEWGNSWKTNTSCPDEVQIVTPDCEPGLQTIIESNERCGKIMEDFQACHSWVDPQAYYEACVFDVCEYQGSLEMLCQTLEAYVQACAEQGLDLGDWRTPTICPLTCPVNSHYTTCASACPATCTDVAAPNQCNHPCKEACECDLGFVLSGEVCVPQEQCGCLKDGIYYPLSAEWSEANGQTCSCRGQNDISCQQVVCEDGFFWNLEDGTWDCRCLPDRDCDGERGPVEAICVSWGDPHYITFDGKNMNFMGACTYILSKASRQNDQLPAFEIQATNDRRGSDRVSYTDSALINIYQHTVILGQGRIVTLNGLQVTPPVNLAQGINIQLSGPNVVLSTTFGLRVSFDGNHRLEVVVPPTYFNTTQGICGNFNGDKADDMLKSDGIMAIDANEWGNSWKTNTSCPNEVQIVTPDCEPGLQTIIESNERCGKIMEDFQACHSWVDPQAYYEACVFDVCEYQGSLEMLCQTLEAYVQACAEQGLDLGDWRTPTICPLTCPVNSHYTTCASACPATCTDVAAPNQCNHPCKEACECDLGFVLSGEVCVPQEQCGCLKDGIYYPLGAEWSEANGQTCSCRGQNDISCQQVVCEDGFFWNLEDGTWDCRCLPDRDCDGERGPVEAICVSWGDPHYITFDGKNMNFMGACTYILSKASRQNDQLPAFEIQATNDRRGSDRVSYTDSALINIYQHTVILGQGRIVTLNGLQVTPPVNLAQGINIQLSGPNVVLSTTFGLRVSFDGNHRLEVVVPPTYFNTTQGICGNFNGDKADDMLKSDGIMAIDANEWGNSWKTNTSCPDEVQIVTPDCEPGLQTIIESNERCGKIMEDFQACHSWVDPQAYYEACVFDVCEYQGSLEMLCQTLEAYVQACAEQGLDLGDWRTPTICPLTCPVNSHYTTCASACPATCTDVAAPNQCNHPCKEACECDLGFVLSGEVCVPQEQCGCLKDGIYYPLGAEWSEANGQTCSCRGQNDISCQQVVCEDGFFWNLEDGTWDCRCLPDRDCDGERGPVEAICVSWGDPHYITFDGKNMNFMGACTYILSKASRQNDQLPAFEIQATNDRRGSDRVSYTDSALINIYQHTVILGQGRIVTLNGLQVTPPVNLAQGINIQLSGPNVVLSTTFGLRVSFDGNHRLEVVVPPTYFNTTQGICGNFNGDKADDMLKSDGIMAIDANEWGNSWKTNTSCPDEVQIVTPDCEPGLQTIIESNERCGKIMEDFQACHSWVDPQAYYEACVFDVCEYQGSLEMLCQTLEAYVQACAEQGLDLGDWRTPTICPLTCPVNSHYTTCASACPATCTDVAAPNQCNHPCKEACECDLGFVLSGEVCVPQEQCGCLKDGIYYPLGAEWSEANGQTCSCRGQNDISCQQVVCEDGFFWNLEDGTWDCRCLPDRDCDGERGPVEAICVSWGDPHYITFDGKNMNFMGACTYILSKASRQNDQLPAFEIQATNDRRGSDRVSYTDSALINIYQHTVILGQGRIVTLNGLQVTPPVNLAQGINIQLSGPNVVLSTTFGLRVSFDGNHRLEVVVPPTYFNTTQGICGNFNGDKADDMLKSDGIMAIDANEWGNSWKTNTSCPDEVQIVTPDCEPGLQTIIESNERCGKIMEDFQACHSWVDPQAYYEACVFDVCEYQGSLEMLCQTLEAYVQACAEQGLDLGDWRTPTICPLTCPVNSHCTTCASACPATCTDVAAPNQCNHPCKEACECDLGFVLSGEVCVPQGQCGCLKDGIYYPLGAEWSEANGQTCSCRGQNDISCQQVVCEDGFFWNLEDGTWDCRCLPDRDCDGERGPVEAICVSWGDPHYITFDGKNMNFMGACTYILSKASRQNDQLPAFEIQATNDRRGSDRVSYTDSALINIYQHTVILGQGRIVTLNGLQVTPPVNLAQGINIQLSGPNVVLSTTFGLRVSFDGNHRLEVVVPPTYFNTTQGICGNFNGDKADDMLKSDGIMAIDANEWGNSWKTNTSCPDEVQIVTPDCEPGLQTIIESNERCGKIMEDFQACHSWVDPQAYYEACVFDVCEYQGSLEMLCQTLEAYVQACAEQGLDLGDWRTPTICPLTCPVNSHYTTCASACPATCTDVAAPNQCNHPCKEACECDLGFVLSGEVCVPQEQCGCLKDGIYYPLSAEWSEANGQTCSCRGQNDISCQQVVCEDGFFWNLEDGTWDCRCLPDRDCDGERGPVEAICVSWGDPHYITFDGKNMNFMGACTYILSKASRQNDQLPAFEIQATNDRRGSDRVSYTDSALINIYQHTVILGQGRIVTLNGLQVTPPVNLAQGINIQLSGPNVVLSTTFGLRVSFDGNHRLEVVVPPTYFNTTQGICGNFNGDKADDMLKSDGIMAIDANEWGNSWKTNTSCPDEVQIVTPDCEPGLQTIIESNERCGKIMEDFQACHSWVDPQAYYEACVFDVCEYQGSLEMLCQTLEAYVQACAEQGLDLGDWRTPTICPLTCPVNSHYTTCASACPATCTDVAAPNQCNHPCKEACECDLGFVLSGEVCVPQEQCGCLKDGIYYPLGAEWSEANGQTCSCRGQNDISCQQVVCEDGFFWNLEDGTWDCRCLPDRDCDGERGPVEAICVSWGDPHYITFDGKNMNFMGACTYILSKASRQNDQLPAFEIQATNDRRGSDRVSYTDSALINIYQHTVILGQGRIVTLNGLQVTPPVNLAQGINIQLSGPNVVLSTTFGLRVSFDGNHRLEVVVPPTYFNTTQGICGNFNGDKADDMLKSDGIMAIDANEWGNSWKTNTSCPDEVQIVTPDCEPGLQTIIESNERCGKIMEDFQACHSWVDPQAYYEACVFDVCEYQGSLEMLCQTLEAYVQACAEQGLDLGDWRTPTICPLTCPVNSHYTTCASACPATCTDVAAPNQCNHPCKEACECDLGFVLSGEVCVPQEQCGCLKDGIYYPLGAEWSEANGQTCSCRGQNDISCQQVVCEDGFFWNLEDGTWDCRCLPDRDCDGERGPVEAICVSWGDPHYITFDGKNMNFMGACTYILSKASRQNDQLPAFEIQATNDRRGSDRVSYTDSALINIYQYAVILGQGRIVTLNGLQVTPPVNLAQGINIQLSGPNVVLSTTFGLRVSFDGNHRLEVVVPPTYFNTTQGICGNFNGDKADDMLKSDGIMAIDANEWGNSWKTNTSCPDEVQIVTPDCEPGLQTIIESNERCGKIMEDFQACHSWVDPQAYYEACVFDVCEYQGSLEMLCQTLEAYVQACAEQGLDLGDWRTPTICPLTCPVNSHYTTCASACPATCTDVAAPNQCNHPCKEACECDLGFVLSGEVCVPQEQCGCLKDGIYYPLGAEWSEANGQTCSCRGQNDISCQQVVCEDGFFWNLEDGTWDCRCLPDRDCDGERGPVEAICVSWGDPHYITFDGKNMNFMGACTYILSKASRQNDQLPAFEIQATNDRRGSDRVSYTDSALINIYQHTVILGQGRIVTLNGLQVTPPVNLAQGINIQLSGPNVVLSTTFGLRVSFDGNHRLEVVVPPTYFNTTQGICGNFNGDKADDMLKSDGIMAIDANDWGNSWKTNTSCPDEVQIVTPDCEPGLQTIIESNERCGKIMEDFQACHSWVDPQAYYEACVFDVCEYQGSLEMLCQTLEAYVQACAEQGLDLGDWRTPTICPLTCPVNSHCTTCASACPATCTDVAAPNQCNHPCKEACECDLGFVLSGEVCVPQGQCGCLKDGIYYPLGAEWSEANGQTCSCRGQNDISCQQVVCEDGFFWNLEDGTWDCRCLPDRDCDGERGPVEAICVSWGDPHYITFDGKNMNFMGACTYILSKASRQNDQLPAFEIQATNDRRGSDRVSYTDSALINIYQHTVILGQGRIVTLNGLQVTPPVNLAQGINIQLSGPNVVLSTTFGLRVSFDGNHRLEVVVPPTYFNTTQGICGNFNGDKADDMLKSDGIMAIDANEWGNSWKTNTSCPDEVQIVTPDCEPGLQTIIESNERCGKIMEDFQACHSWVDPQAYYEACVFDVCEYQGSLEMLCQTLEAYVQACAEQGLDLGNWRTPTVCPLACPINSHYTSCASACPATCTDVAAPNQCNHPCKEACECDLGFVLSGEVCVPQEQCGCLKDGIYYPLGAEWSEANGQTCSCRGQNDISCQQVVCEDGFFWNLEDGTWDCRCLPDRDCDGERGPVEAICVSWGDPHYLTFDGKNLNYQGACTYILSKASRQNDQLPAFEIQATNDRRGSDRVSYTDSARINIYQHSVVLGQGRAVTLNGLQVTPPVNLAQGINIQLSGPNVVLSTTFGLRVSFDGNHRLEVVVPPTYFNTTQGICGNFNGDQTDDMLKSDGSMAIDAVEWGNSWKTNTSCPDEVVDVVPDCDSGLQTIIESDQRCGKIMEDFQACHSWVDPQAYYDACVYDVCEYQGSLEILCQTLEAYVQACAEQGVDLGDWRTPTICPLACPINSHYTTCASACPATCTDVAAPNQCNHPCKEACECDLGFVLSGEVCVPYEQCGCVKDGFYHPVGEEWGDVNGEVCTCRGKDDIQCQDVTCDEGFFWSLQDGRWDCYCLPDRNCTEDETLVEEGICVSWGDPHYLTFDGRNLNYQGACTYILARAEQQTDVLPAFEIQATNDRRGSDRVSYTDSARITVFRHTVILGQSRVVTVNVL